MQDTADILQVTSRLTLIKLVVTHKVLINIWKMIYGGLMMLQICFGMQKLRHCTTV